MKRAMILLVLLPALLLSGSVYAAARVNSTRDAACFSPVVLTGDPELCEGVTIRAYTSFSDSRGLNIGKSSLLKSTISPVSRSSQTAKSPSNLSIVYSFISLFIFLSPFSSSFKNSLIKP